MHDKTLHRLFALAGAMLLLVAACSSGITPQATSGSETRAAATPSIMRPATPSAPAEPAPVLPTPTEPAATPQPTPATETPSSTPTPSRPTPAAFPSGITPVRLTIPAIEVDAAVVDLDLAGDDPEVPTNFDDTGWYVQTRRPGEIGPAVIAGHVDSVSGPEVFVDLDELVVGDEITVHGDDGETRTFVVVDTGRYPKDELPPEVFGFGDGVPELRLITCGGDFDRSIGHYRDNQVVYARQVSPPPA